jgi:nucleotide-binding universal stress UspA family protein
MERVVVGVDGSDGAAVAVRWAAAQAQRRGQSLVAVLAWGFLDQHHPDPDASFDPDYDADAAGAALDTYLTRALGAEGAADVARVVTSDLAAPALLQAAEGAALLVVGARGLGGFRGLLLGSVSQQCLQRATCPVAVVRPETLEREAAGERAGPGRIVVGVDSSEAARRALQWAIAETEIRKAALTVVHSWHLPYVGGYPLAGAVMDPTQVEEAARDTLVSIVEREDTAELAVPIAEVLAMGGPAAAILETAADADLVVVGSRGFGGFRGLLLGSVSQQVAQHASCPVIVVPPAG